MEDPVAVETSRALRGLAALLDLPRPRGGHQSGAQLVAELQASNLRNLREGDARQGPSWGAAMQPAVGLPAICVCGWRNSLSK